MYHMWYTLRVVGRAKSPTRAHPQGAPLEKHGKRVPAIFYRAEAGREPVREWLKNLPREDRKRIGEDIKTVEFGWPIGMPVLQAAR